MVNREKFNESAKLLETGEEQLSFEMIGDVFGQDFWVMLVASLLDAQSAARAIQGAINRLSQAENKQQNLVQ